MASGGPAPFSLEPVVKDMGVTGMMASALVGCHVMVSRCVWHVAWHGR